MSYDLENKLCRGIDFFSFFFLENVIMLAILYLPRVLCHCCCAIVAYNLFWLLFKSQTF